VVGRWRIVGSDVWDCDHLDLENPAFINVGRGGRGELAFGVVNASLDLSYSRTIVFSTFEGLDEGDEVNGSGSADRPLIKESRFGVFYEGLVWEVDEFQGDNAGLIVAELE